MIYQGFLFVILLILAHFKPLKNCRVVQYMVFEKKAPQKSCHEGHKKRTKSSFYKLWSKVNSLFHQNLSLLNINDAQEKIWPFRLYIFGYTHGRNVVMKVTSWSSWRSQTKNFQKYPIICIHYGVIMKELTFCLFCTHNRVMRTKIYDKIHTKRQNSNNLINLTFFAFLWSHDLRMLKFLFHKVHFEIVDDWLDSSVVKHTEKISFSRKSHFVMKVTSWRSHLKIAVVAKVFDENIFCQMIM